MYKNVTDDDGEILLDSTYEEYMTTPVLDVTLGNRYLNLTLPSFLDQYFEKEFLAIISERPIRANKGQIQEEVEIIQKYCTNREPFVEISAQKLWQGVVEVKHWGQNSFGGYTFLLEWSEKASEKEIEIMEGTKQKEDFTF